MLKIGKPAPNFTLLNQAENSITLRDFIGRKVVLFTFIAVGAPACSAQVSAFETIFPALQQANVILLGIGIDSPESLGAWHRELGLPFDLLADPDHDVLEKYDAWDGLSFKARSFAAPLRSYWMIDESGILRAGQTRVTVDMCVQGVCSALDINPE
ncbi:MAG: redoxin domain-containing protein [Aggregatilineales bacterium]